jgi:hypothetical protein
MSIFPTCHVKAASQELRNRKVVRLSLQFVVSYQTRTPLLTTVEHILQVWPVLSSAELSLISDAGDKFFSLKLSMQNENEFADLQSIRAICMAANE